jgi:hypothetical protein
MIGPKFATKATFDKYWHEKMDKQAQTLKALDRVVA